MSYSESTMRSLFKLAHITAAISVAPAAIAQNMGAMEGTRDVKSGSVDTMEME
jgi:hypothetical protein